MVPVIGRLFTALPNDLGQTLRDHARNDDGFMGLLEGYLYDARPRNQKRSRQTFTQHKTDGINIAFGRCPRLPRKKLRSHV